MGLAVLNRNLKMSSSGSVTRGGGGYYRTLRPGQLSLTQEQRTEGDGRDYRGIQRQTHFWQSGYLL